MVTISDVRIAKFGDNMILNHDRAIYKWKI